MNRTFYPPFHSSIHRTIACWLIGIVTALTASGCMSRAQRPQLTEKRDLASPNALQLVGDLARPWGLKWIEAEGVSLTVGLDGTGSNPAPSADYKLLISDMQVREVEQPEAVLSSSSTAMTIVRALIPPGAQKGDRVDVQVRVPAKSKTKSLEGGWLMLSRLKEFARVNGRLSSGHLMAMSQGNILVDSLLESSDDPVLKTRGRILGGGVITKSRELGLRVRDENLSIRTSARVGEMINRRFHIYDHGEKKGVANPKKDSFISLVVHPRYRDNLLRYIRVIENVPVRESSSDLVQRLSVLETRLFDPASSSIAAVQLEAIGDDAISVLQGGLRVANPEVRFYSAEALAYLNEPAAAVALADSIRNEPAFRWRAFRALGAMDDLAAQEELAMLLSEESAETRYGAFRTLVKLSPDDPLVRGVVIGEEFSLHTVEASTSPLVHVSKSDVAEIVIFGQNVSLKSPLVAFAGNRIVVRSTEGDRILIRRLSEDDADERQRIVDAKLSDVIHAIADLGGGYADVVQVIAEAQAKDSLSCRLEFGAIPQPGRKFDRESQDGLPLAKSSRDGMSKGVELRDAGAESSSSENLGQTEASKLRQVGSGMRHDSSSLTMDSGTAMVTPVFDGEFVGDEESAKRMARAGGQPHVSTGDGKHLGPVEIVISDQVEDLPGAILFDQP